MYIGSSPPNDWNEYPLHNNDGTRSTLPLVKAEYSDYTCNEFSLQYQKVAVKAN